MAQWTHPICTICWSDRNPGRDPVRVKDAVIEVCCYCGLPTASGIYIRADPATLPHPAADLSAQTVRDIDWLRGYFAAIEDYAIWNDGVQRIGVMGELLKNRKAQVLKEHGWDGQSPLPEGLTI